MASIRFPYPPYLLKVIRRSLGTWLLVRSAYAGALLGTAGMLNILPPAEVVALALHPSWATRGVLMALAAGMVWWDRRRSHELLLPANLGAWPGWFWTASLLAALVLDVGVQALVAAY